MNLINYIQNGRSCLDTLSEWVGKCCSWLVFLLVFLVAYDVAMRYLFNSGSIAIQELQWHLFSVIFLFGAAYTLKHDDHVRLDMIYQSEWLNDKARAWINLLGSLVMLIPFCIMVMLASDLFVIQSWSFNETSPDPGGLSYRWLIKAAIPMGFLFLLVEGINQVFSNLLIILGKQK